MLSKFLSAASSLARREKESVSFDNSTISLADLFSSSVQGVAGVHATPENAMRIAAVYRCVTLIAGVIASMPLFVYKRAETGIEPDFEHPMQKFIISAPEMEVPFGEYIESATINMLLKGNDYAHIWRKKSGKIFTIQPAMSGVLERMTTGHLRYHLALMNDTTIIAHPEDTLHFRGPGWNGVGGMTPVKGGNSFAIGIALAANEFVAKYFENGMSGDDIVIMPKGMKDGDVTNWMDYWGRKVQGLMNSHAPIALREGMEHKQRNSNAKESQLFELLVHSAIEVARAWGVPPHMIGSTEKSTSWGSGLEEQTKGFLQYTLMPHTVRMAGEMNKKLFPTMRSFVQFDYTELLKGNSADLAEYYAKALGTLQSPGWMVVKEVRDREGLVTLPDTDELQKPTQNPDPETEPKKDKKDEKEKPDDEDE